MYFVLHSRCPICRLSSVRIVDLAGSRDWIDGMGRLPVGVPFFVPDALLAIVRVCLLAGLILFFYLEHQIGTGLKAEGVENLDYIIVLGCQVKGTKPSKALKDRLDTAKEYLQANPETIAVLSGGQGKMEEISEAECMRRYLEKAGISRERLILEQRSTTTRQNLRYSRRYMDMTRLESLPIIFMYTAAFFWQDEVAIREYVALLHRVRVYCYTIILCEKLLRWQGKCCIKDNDISGTKKINKIYINILTYSEK